MTSPTRDCQHCVLAALPRSTFIIAASLGGSKRMAGNQRAPRAILLFSMKNLRQGKKAILPQNQRRRRPAHPFQQVQVARSKCEASLVGAWPKEMRCSVALWPFWLAVAVSVCFGRAAVRLGPSLNEDKSQEPHHKDITWQPCALVKPGATALLLEIPTLHSIVRSK